ncbi:DUF4192 domain-containing protein [Streptomyces sp. NPDC088387]|uniref:DUF4192 domain-containing protein n=1 Tax=Streptomyces sp. NPDC088387 TaxID=3365859 RepID=UPI0037FE57BC
MTNHGESTGSCDNSGSFDNNDITAYVGHGGSQQVTLRTPAELADALPYLLGYRPEDSIVLVALHDKDGRGRFGGRARLGIPTNADDWPSVAKQLAHGLVTGSRRRGTPPEQIVAYVCREPAAGQTGQDVMAGLRPLIQHLRVECGLLDVPVIEALCISDNRFWSYCCATPSCCPPEGAAMGLPGTSVLAAAATYAGVQVRGTLRELRARLLPLETAAVLDQESALDRAGMALVPRILDDANRASVATETLQLAERVMRRLTDAPTVSGTLLSDLRDDELLTHQEAATLILGLQDRTTRDRAAEWMEGDEAAPALRLWRALARRCVGPYSEHAAAPLTLAGWVAWSTGDELEAREALAMALGADRDYLFARLLHQAANEGLDPESIRRCLRRERTDRGRNGDEVEAVGVAGVAASGAMADGPVGAEVGEPDTGVKASTDEELASGMTGSPAVHGPSAADGTPSRRRRRARPAGGAAGVSPAARADSRAPGSGTHRPAASVGRTRSAGARTRVTRPSATAGDGVNPAHSRGDGAQAGGGGSDAGD